MDIIIKKTPSNRAFHPHMNHALGKYYHSKHDYLSDMKKAGLEPYDGYRKEYKPKKYKPSKWAHEMVEARRHMSKASGRWRDEVNRVSGYKPEVHDKMIGKTKLNNMEGGFLES